MKKDSQESKKDILKSGRPDIRIRQLGKTIEEQNKLILHIRADYQNLQKRMLKDIERAKRTSMVEAWIDILEFYDLLVMAIGQSPDSDNPAVTSWTQGIESIVKKIEITLESNNITSIPSIGRKFTPLLHEAFSFEPAPEQEGIIIKEISKGYTINNEVLKIAKVVVSSGSEKK